MFYPFSRFLTEKKHLSIGNYDDDYISSFYYPAIAFSINNATLAVQIAETHPDDSTVDCVPPKLNSANTMYSLPHRRLISGVSRRKSKEIMDEIVIR